MSTADRGFASMDANKQRKIASAGGKASHGGGMSKSSASSSRATGAAGKTEAAKRGGMNSHRGSNN